MDRVSLAARIQEILRNRPHAPADAPRADGAIQPEWPRHATGPQAAQGDEDAAFAARCAAAAASSDVLDTLGATIVDGRRGPCVVVDRRYPATHLHGRHAVGHYVAAASHAHVSLPAFLGRAGALPLSAGADAASRLLFFDLETTGLSGGAGTYAFLVGCASFDEDGFRTRQFFLRGFGEERALLHAVEDEVAAIAADQVPVLVTYNGRAFDIPLVETRYQFHRLRSPFEAMAHVDMLFPARRLWKRRVKAGPLAPDEPQGSCALTAIERDILGLSRQDDVPGWEIPSRYFGYARTGDARGLMAVFEHNRLDLLSLAAVSAVILEMVREGAAVARERHDCLALGRLLEYVGHLDDAEQCYAAAALDDGMLERNVDRMVRADALHWLARHRRRARRFDEAATAWLELSEIAGLEAALRREALEALAIHHEHRARNLEAARVFATRALALADDAKRADEVRHRLGRLSRKLDGA